jgi:hypothetical protein
MGLALRIGLLAGAPAFCRDHERHRIARGEGRLERFVQQELNVIFERHGAPS